MFEMVICYFKLPILHLKKLENAQTDVLVYFYTYTILPVSPWRYYATKFTCGLCTCAFSSTAANIVVVSTSFNLKDSHNANQLT